MSGTVRGIDENDLPDAYIMFSNPGINSGNMLEDAEVKQDLNRQYQVIEPKRLINSADWKTVRMMGLDNP